MREAGLHLPMRDGGAGWTAGAGVGVRPGKVRVVRREWGGSVSKVTNVMILALCGEEKAIIQLSLYAHDFCKGMPFEDATDVGKSYAGDKYAEVTVLIGAFNYFGEEKVARLARAVEEVDWDCPDNVQMMVKYDEDDWWSFVKLKVKGKKRDA